MTRCKAEYFCSNGFFIELHKGMHDLLDIYLPYRPDKELVAVKVFSEKYEDMYVWYSIEPVGYFIKDRFFIGRLVKGERDRLREEIKSGKQFALRKHRPAPSRSTDPFDFGGTDSKPKPKATRRSATSRPNNRKPIEDNSTHRY